MFVQIEREKAPTPEEVMLVLGAASSSEAWAAMLQGVSQFLIGS